MRRANGNHIAADAVLNSAAMQADRPATRRSSQRLISAPHASNPPLPPNTVVLQLTPGDDLRGLGEHCFKFHILNRIGRLFRLNHSADQKVLLFGDGYDGGPLGQQQFFGVQRVHA
jgi:hypothetical protein